tara:strand:+ start:1148 stop:1417 length:270 start_codon:yes stop_codon:yes gene_type:complete
METCDICNKKAISSESRHRSIDIFNEQIYLCENCEMEIEKGLNTFNHNKLINLLLNNDISINCTTNCDDNIDLDWEFQESPNPWKKRSK